MVVSSLFVLRHLATDVVHPPGDLVQLSASIHLIKALGGGWEPSHEIKSSGVVPHKDLSNKTF
jgi:hypothetical protein